MSCRSCDLKRIYRLFEEKKRREAEETKVLAEASEREVNEVEDATKRTRKKKAYIPVEAVVEPAVETTEEVKTEEPAVEESRSEDDFGLI